MVDKLSNGLEPCDTYTSFCVVDLFLLYDVMLLGVEAWSQEFQPSRGNMLNQMLSFMLFGWRGGWARGSLLLVIESQPHGFACVNQLLKSRCTLMLELNDIIKLQHLVCAPLLLGLAAVGKVCLKGGRQAHLYATIRTTTLALKLGPHGFLWESWDGFVGYVSCCFHPPSHVMVLLRHVWGVSVWLVI